MGMTLGFSLFGHVVALLSSVPRVRLPECGLRSLHRGACEERLRGADGRRLTSMLQRPTISMHEPWPPRRNTLRKEQNFKKLKKGTALFVNTGRGFDGRRAAP